MMGVSPPAVREALRILRSQRRSGPAPAPAPGPGLVPASGRVREAGEAGKVQRGLGLSQRHTAEPRAHGGSPAGHGRTGSRPRDVQPQRYGLPRGAGRCRRQAPMSVAIPAAWTAMPESVKDGWPGVRDRSRADHHAVFKCAVFNCVEADQAEQAADLLDAPIGGFATHMSTVRRPARHHCRARLTNTTRTTEPLRGRRSRSLAAGGGRGTISAPSPTGSAPGDRPVPDPGPPGLGSRRPSPVRPRACPAWPSPRARARPHSR
jgi:hypothetical protein